MKAGLALLALALFAGCSRAKPTGTPLEFWTLQLEPEFTPYLESLKADYEKSHPGVTVRIVDVPYVAVVQKLMAALGAGDAPDVVNLSSDFLSKFSQFDALLPLDERLTPAQRAAFLPNALAYGVLGGKTVALPWYLNTYVLFYNKDMLAQGGFSKKDVPRTFDEMVSFARRFKDKTGRFAFFMNIGKDSFLPMALESDGIPMLSPDGRRAAFDAPAAVDAVDRWVALFRDGYLPRESISGRLTSVIEPYMSGQVASVFTGPVFVNRVQLNAPGVFKATGIAPALVGRTGRSELAVMSLAVPATSKHPREALDFALFVLNAKNQLAFSKIETTYPSVKDALKDRFFTAEDGTLLAEARVAGARELSAAGRLRTYFLKPQFDELDEAFDEAIQAACLGQMTTREALQKAAARWNALLAASGEAGG